MEKRALGRRHQELSVVGYGAWITGADTASNAIDRAGVRRAIRAALDAGITWIDTAEIYAAGLSEETVGEVLGRTRDRVFVATKVAPAGAGTGVRPREIARAIRASLGRLGTDRLDLYQLHWHDPSVPLEETWGAMRRLVDEGLARFVGVSNLGRSQIERCLAVGPVDAVQNQLSLIHREDGEGLPGWLADRGVAYLAYGSLAFGLLSGGVTLSTSFDRMDWRSGEHARYERNYYEELFAPGRRDRHLAFINDLADLADRVGLPLPVLALRWVLEQRGVTAVVVGSQNPRHIRINARAGQLRIDPDTRALVGDLLGRHYGSDPRSVDADENPEEGSDPR